ncbi:MAG: valine--tRNA ligase, partial [Candidatus Omnitrophica bacterium]|nr:valine--tRNA ligase [Candidatus Omnitrophota bacterium]
GQKNTATVIVGNIKGVVPLGELIDVDQEKKRILGQITEQKKVSTGLTSRLKNKDFLKKAPKEVVDKEKIRLDSINTKIEELEKVVSGLTS